MGMIEKEDRTIEVRSEAAVAHGWKGTAAEPVRHVVSDRRRLCPRLSHFSTIVLWGHIILCCDGGPEHCSMTNSLQGLRQLNGSTNLQTAT